MQKIGMLTITFAAFALAALAPIASAADLYFPGDQWESVKPESVGWDTEKIAAAIEFAMSRQSSGVLILHNGRILAEKYQDIDGKSASYVAMTRGQTNNGRSIEDVASVQKSIVSFLVGVAQEKGHIQIGDPIHQHLGVGWSKAKPEQEAAITIQHLVSMNSGLNTRLKHVADAGKKWQYNTNAYSRSLRAVAAATGKSPNELTKQWLTDPIGMKDSRWVDRPFAGLADADANKIGFATTNRDLARFGLLMLAQGKWKQQTLLADQDFLSDSISPSQQLNPAYGYLWWLNGQEKAIRGSRPIRGKLIPTAPDDLYAAIGALGRKCYVVPSLELVVTRLGDSPDDRGKPKFDNEFWRLLMKAAPESKTALDHRKETE